MEWTQQNITILTDMWHNGFTARQIAQKIGLGVTRNAVIGKAHRMGLSQRPAPAVKRDRPSPLSLGVMKDCQWPFGDPTSREFYYCSAPVKTGKSYCEEHCNLAYRNLYDEAESNSSKANNKTGTKISENAE